MWQQQRRSHGVFSAVGERRHIEIFIVEPYVGRNVDVLILYTTEPHPHFNVSAPLPRKGPWS